MPLSSIYWERRPMTYSTIKGSSSQIANVIIFITTFSYLDILSNIRKKGNPVGAGCPKPVMRCMILPAGSCMWSCNCLVRQAFVLSLYAIRLAIVAKSLLWLYPPLYPDVFLQPPCDCTSLFQFFQIVKSIHNAAPPNTCYPPHIGILLSLWR